MARFALDITKETGANVDVLTLGGGFGVHYTDADRTHPVSAYVERMHAGIVRVYEAAKRPFPNVHIEPGGGAAISSQKRVLRSTPPMCEKSFPASRTYVSVDGGMADNPRPMLYQAKYDALIANRPLDTPEETVHLAGCCCESGDILIEDLPLPKDP